jgi:hypothetical protein
MKNLGHFDVPFTVRDRVGSLMPKGFQASSNIPLQEG